MRCSRILSAITNQRLSITSQMSLQRGINLRALAEKMGQCSGAEVRGICTEAGMFYPILALFFLGLNPGFRYVRPTGKKTTRHAGGLRVCGGKGQSLSVKCLRTY